MCTQNFVVDIRVDDRPGNPAHDRPDGRHGRPDSHPSLLSLGFHDPGGGAALDRGPSFSTEPLAGNLIDGFVKSPSAALRFNPALLDG